jgi:REP element-mobilizing transposase RayT
VNEKRANSGGAVWQRSYFERIIRNELELAAFREYIMNNPARWALDRENPSNIVHRP